MDPFEDWPDVARIVCSALIVYACVIAAIRIIGKRSVSKMNNYDWIVTVALGSMCGSIILLKDVPIGEGLAGVFTLLAVQWAVTRFAAKAGWVRRLVHAQSTLVYFDGEFIDDHLIRERVSRSEVTSAVRSAGIGDFAEVAAVLLEASGELAVIKKGTGNLGCVEEVSKPQSGVAGSDQREGPDR